jgi:hypothetical protein
MQSSYRMVLVWVQIVVIDKLDYCASKRNLDSCKDAPNFKVGALGHAVAHSFGRLHLCAWQLGGIQLTAFCFQMRSSSRQTSRARTSSATCCRQRRSTPSCTLQLRCEQRLNARCAL